jgi:hypothetical protein
MMAVVAKLPTGHRNGNTPVRLPDSPRGIWQRWNRQMSLVVFIIGLGALWLAISLLLVLEIQ